MKNSALPRFLVLCLGAFLIGTLLAGCGGKKEIPPVPVGEMEEYKDPGYGFRVLHPKGWIANTEVGRAHFYNTAEVDKRFLDPTGPFPDGVMLAVDIIKTENPDSAQKKMVADMKEAQFQLQAPQQVTLGGKPATKVPFTAMFSKSSIQTGYHIYLNADTMLYDVQAIGYAGLGEAHQAVFDACLAGFKLPAPVVAGKDETLPSEVYTKFDTKLFSLDYPENFNFSTPKSTFEFSSELRGYRQDCSIRFDVFDAKKLTVDKVLDQNKGKYKSKGSGKATIGGEQALYLNYASTAQVDSRVYFAVHSDKVYRVTLNWFKPQEKEYMAAFEKILGSVKYK